jgi:hypothetical protein
MQSMGASCYAITCTSPTSLTIRVGGSGASVACAAGSGGQAKTTAGYSGTITCPEPASVCGPVTKYGGSSSSSSSSSGSGGGTAPSLSSAP